jgi:16S rRNA processing protein RimM
MTDSKNSLTENSDSDLVVVGRVRRPTGIKGALLVEIYSGDPRRFSRGDVVIANGEEYEIIETGKSGTSQKLTFATINSIEKADVFRDVELSVTQESLPENPDGVYYHYEIIGKQVVTTEGQELGRLTAVLETGSNDVLIVSPKPGTVVAPEPVADDGAESASDSASSKPAANKPRVRSKKPKKNKKPADILIPVLDGVIVGVDQDTNVMTIELPGGII